MKIIAHRANINGSNLGSENRLSQIKKCINFGYDVEVDIRFHENKLYLCKKFVNLNGKYITTACKKTATKSINKYEGHGPITNGLSANGKASKYIKLADGESKVGGKI